MDVQALEKSRLVALSMLGDCVVNVLDQAVSVADCERAISSFGVDVLQYAIAYDSSSSSSSTTTSTVGGLGLDGDDAAAQAFALRVHRSLLEALFRIASDAGDNDRAVSLATRRLTMVAVEYAESQHDLFLLTRATRAVADLVVNESNAIAMLDFDSHDVRNNSLVGDFTR